MKYAPTRFTTFCLVMLMLAGLFAAKQLMAQDCGLVVYVADESLPNDGDTNTDTNDGEPTQTFDGPDGNVKLVEISDDGVHWHHSFNAYPGQKLQVRVRVTNKGDEIIDYFEVFVHRSPDKDFSQEHDHSYGREEETDDLAPGEGDDKHREINSPNTPGVYYIFAYVNRVDGKYGGVDHHWTNNLSRNHDPDEYGVLRVAIPPPWANFSANPKLGLSPLVVQFTDASRWSPTFWQWNFGDGQTSTEQHPSHTYNFSGIYTVTLTAGNEKGQTTETKTGFVKVDVPPSIKITNPTSTDNWRSINVKDIRWTYSNFPSRGTVKIEYSFNNGSTWRLISANADNDGIKHWDMCDSYTTNTSNARIRITSNLYPSVQAISARFTIDHARGCK